MKDNGKLYVLCSDKFKDNPVYAIVQGSHAMAEYLKNEIADSYDCEEDYEYWRNYTIVYVWYDHRSLQYYDYPFGSMSNKYIPYYKWKEPDQDNEVTAACFWDIDALNIKNHDPYWYVDETEEIRETQRDIDKLQLVK